MGFESEVGLPSCRGAIGAGLNVGRPPTNLVHENYLIRVLTTRQ